MNPKTVADVHCAVTENILQKENFLAAIHPDLLNSTLESREAALVVLEWLHINQAVSASYGKGLPEEGTKSHYEYYGYIGAIGGVADYAEKNL